jgi:hypothetical protein
MSDDNKTTDEEMLRRSNAGDSAATLYLANTIAKSATRTSEDLDRAEILFKLAISQGHEAGASNIIRFLVDRYPSYDCFQNRVNYLDLQFISSAQYWLYRKALIANLPEVASSHLMAAANYGHIFAKRDLLRKERVGASVIKYPTFVIKLISNLAIALMIFWKNESDPRLR